MQPRKIYQPLKGLSGDTQTITVTGTSRKATFRLDHLTARQGDEWCYVQKIRLFIQTQLDQAASGGSAITADILYNVLSSIKLSCDDLGVLYSEGDLNGASLGLAAQVVSAGYRFPQILRADIAATDGDSTVDLVVDIPIGHECFTKGHQTGVWSGFFKSGGQLEVTLAASTWPATWSTGMAGEATTDIRAEAIMTCEKEARLPQIWAWRTHTTPGSETKHLIRNLCQGSGIKGASGSGKIAFLAYLCDVTGMGGADGADNLLRIYPRDRGVDSLNHGSPVYAAGTFLTDFVSELSGRNPFSVAGKGYGYPLNLSAAATDFPNLSTALFVPYFWPHAGGQDVSKCQEWSGDYLIEHEYTSTPSGEGKWLALELAYLTAAQEQYLMRERMNLSPGAFVAIPKVKTLRPARDPASARNQAQKLRGIPKKIQAR